MLDSIGKDLDEARAKIEQTRQALQAALEGSDQRELRQAVGRLERIEAELERIEGGIAVREGLG